MKYERPARLAAAAQSFALVVLRQSVFGALGSCQCFMPTCYVHGAMWHHTERGLKLPLCHTIRIQQPSTCRRTNHPSSRCVSALVCGAWCGPGAQRYRMAPRGAPEAPEACGCQRCHQKMDIS